ncbi:MAG: CRTAC1 family protein [Sandaracinaceae bacterium]|nr:CRTAC1 family protein [Sandaracinaceae bacterium]
MRVGAIACVVCVWLGASVAPGCAPSVERADAGRRDAARNDATLEGLDAPGLDTGRFVFPDAPFPPELDAHLDAGPPPARCFEEAAAEVGLADPFGPYRRAPDCLFDDPAHDGPGDHCDAEWALAGATVGDANGDGHDDLFVTRIGRAPSLYMNDGTGHFVDEAATRGLSLAEPTAASAFGDVDGDGDLDLYVTVVGGMSHHLFLNDGGSFHDVALARGASLTSSRPLLGSSVTFGDYDRDGDLDLYVGEWRFHSVHDGPSMARLLRNRGPAMPGYFEDVTSSAGVSMQDAWSGVAMPGVYVYAASMVDLDDDGAIDLAINGDFRTSRLFFGRGDGTFVDGARSAGVGTETNAMGMSLADLDDDGDLDWLVTSIWMEFGPDWGNRLYRNEGARRFTEVTSEAGVLAAGWAWGAAFFDYDNDRALDLAVANGWDFAPHDTDAMQLLHGEGAFRFRDVAVGAGIDDRGQGRGVVVLDADADGDLDLFVARYGDVPRYYRNTCGSEASWLRVRVRGPGGALREGLGARVTMRESAGAPLRTVAIGQTSHFLGQSERVAHFGLGDHAGSVAELRVTLPDGTSREIADRSIDHELVVTVP